MKAGERVCVQTFLRPAALFQLTSGNPRSPGGERETERSIGANADFAQQRRPATHRQERCGRLSPILQQPRARPSAILFVEGDG